MKKDAPFLWPQRNGAQRNSPTWLSAITYLLVFHINRSNSRFYGCFLMLVKSFKQWAQWVKYNIYGLLRKGRIWVSHNSKSNESATHTVTTVTVIDMRSIIGECVWAVASSRGGKFISHRRWLPSKQQRVFLSLVRFFLFSSQKKERNEHKHYFYYLYYYNIYYVQNRKKISTLKIRPNIKTCYNFYNLWNRLLLKDFTCVRCKK